VRPLQQVASRWASGSSYAGASGALYRCNNVSANADNNIGARLSIAIRHQSNKKTKQQPSSPRAEIAGEDLG
jgi:hypothetical protein